MPGGGFGGSPMPGGGFGGGPTPGAAGGEEAKPTAKIPDPMFPDNPAEDQANDTTFAIRLAVSIVDPDEGGDEGGTGEY